MEYKARTLFERACQGKISYVNRDEARVALRKHQGIARLAVYPCPFCNMFHLGKRLSPKERKARRKAGREARAQFYEAGQNDTPETVEGQSGPDTSV